MDFNPTLENKNFELGEVNFSEKEIIDFAKINDPLDFHTNIDVAKQSRFKGLVCSGSQAFNYFYVNRWIPLFGNSVVAGLSVNNWNFLAPIYANETIECNCILRNLNNTMKQNEWVIKWAFEFVKKDKLKVQELELTVLHKQIEC